MPNLTKCQKCQNHAPTEGGCAGKEGGCEDHIPKFHEAKINIAIRFYGEYCSDECNMLFPTNNEYFCRLFGKSDYLKVKDDKFIREKRCIKTIKEG